MLRSLSRAAQPLRELDVETAVEELREHAQRDEEDGEPAQVEAYWTRALPWCDSSGDRRLSRNARDRHQRTRPSG